jgi:aminoglycoside N3'-acetyltransferase
MPALYTAEDAIAASRRGNPVDLRTLHSVNGQIADTFRALPGVYRSSHPFSSFCAWGKNAQYITSGHDADYRTSHPQSPLARLLEVNGKIVGLGTSMGPISFYHVLEDTWDGFPFNPYSEPVDVTYIDSHGRTVTRRIAVYDRAKTHVRIDNELGVAVREFFTDHMRNVGVRHDFRFGNAPSFWMSARALYEEMKLLASRGITIYSPKERFE